MTDNRSGQKQLRIILVSILLVAGIAYVYFALSPSHYSFFLKNHMGQTYEPIMGQGYGVRSDEWGVVTPYFQIAVNNNYQRFNQDSPYKEDLRFYYGLPLKDWALAFKPYMWGFFTLGEARGFSFYHFFMIAAFIAGYTIFLNLLGLPLLYSIIIALTLFFTNHNQVWWSGNAPVYGLTIWIIIPFLTRWPLVVKFLATFLLSAAALLGLIYPPWQISMVYVFGILALAFRMDRFRLPNLLVVFLGFAAAVGLCLYYLADVVPLMQNTVYPGDRSFSGGLGPLYYLWTLIFPHSLIDANFAPIPKSIPTNIGEIGTVSTLLTLALITFGDYKALFKAIQKQRLKASILVAFLVLIFSWMYLPIPNTFGKFLLFDQIQAKRFLMASGTTVTMLVAILALHNVWKLSWLRLAVYSFIVLIGSYSFKLSFGEVNAIDYFDALVLVPVLVVFILQLVRFDYSKRQRQLSYLFAMVALIYNVVAFGGFNPLQSTHDIFSIPNNPKVNTLKNFADDNNLGDLILSRHTAAAASGMSLSTYNHVLAVPQLQLFRELFPDLDEVKFNTIFNRYMHVSFDSDLLEPALVQADAVNLPVSVGSIGPKIMGVAQTSPINASELFEIQALSNDWIMDGILLLKFTSPVPLRRADAIIIMPLLDGRDKDEVSASLTPVLQFTQYFSNVDSSPNDAITWELELDFSDIENARAVYEDLESVIINVGDENYRVLLQENEIVIAFDAKQEVTYPVKGVVGGVLYDRTTATLRLNGWAPIPDSSSIKFNEQQIRWFGYDTDLDLELIRLQTIPRPDVAKIFGPSQRLSGYSLLFKVNNPPAFEDDVAFCLYSRTDVNSVYQLSINTDTVPIVCN